MIPRPFRIRLLGATSFNPSTRTASSLASSTRHETKYGVLGDASNRSLDGYKHTNTSVAQITTALSSITLGRQFSTSSRSPVSSRSMHTFVQPAQSPPRTHGRRRKRTLVLAAAREKLKSTQEATSTRPQIVSSSRFQRLQRTNLSETPILCSPIQAEMHVNATLSHLPLPIPLGTDIYSLQNVIRESSVHGSELPSFIFGDSERSIWIDKSLPSPGSEKRRNEAFQAMMAGQEQMEMSTILGDHLNIVESLDAADLAQTTPSQSVLNDGDWDGSEQEDIQAILRDRQTRYNIESDMEWNKILRDLGDKSASTTDSAALDLSGLDQNQSLQVKDAISNLFSTLHRLDKEPKRARRNRKGVVSLGHGQNGEEYVEVINPDSGETMLVSIFDNEHGGRTYKIIDEEEGEDSVYNMTSVVRKKRLKIKKHKYKKRRKEQRALRKRLGH